MSRQPSTRHAPGEADILLLANKSPPQRLKTKPLIEIALGEMFRAASQAAAV